MALLKRINKLFSYVITTLSAGGSAVRKRRCSKIKIPTSRAKCAREMGHPSVSDLRLGHFYQLHFAVSGAVQDHDFALRVAKDEHVAVFEMRLFNCLFERHGAYSDGVVRPHEMNFSRSCDGRILVDHHRHSRLFRETDGRLNRFLLRMAVPLVLFFTFAGRTLLRLPTRLVLDRLLLEVLDGLIHGDGHVLGLG